MAGLVVVKFPNRTGIPADLVENTFAVDGDVTAGGVRSAVSTAVSRFYGNIGAGQTNAVWDYFHDGLSRATNAVELEIYDLTGHLDGSPHGSPLTVDFFTLSAGLGGDGEPTSASCVLAIEADLAGFLERGGVDVAIPTPESAIDSGAPATHTGFDKPRARRRGRIYLPALNSGGFTNDALGNHGFTALFLSDVKAAANSLKIALSAAPAPWSVWSRRNAGVAHVVGGWVHNYPETRRRRGVGVVGSAARTLWP